MSKEIPKYPDPLFYDYTKKYEREPEKEIEIDTENIKNLKEYSNHIIFIPNKRVIIKNSFYPDHCPGSGGTLGHWEWTHGEVEVEPGQEIFISFADRDEIEKLMNFGTVKLSSYQGGVPEGLPKEYMHMDYHRLEIKNKKIETGKYPPSLDIEEIKANKE